MQEIHPNPLEIFRNPKPMDFYRFPMDLGGFLARGFALISLLFTRHFHPLAGSTLNLEPPRRFANRESYEGKLSKFVRTAYFSRKAIYFDWETTFFVYI